MTDAERIAAIRSRMDSLAARAAAMKAAQLEAERDARLAALAEMPPANVLPI